MKDFISMAKLFIAGHKYFTAAYVVNLLAIFLVYFLDDTALAKSDLFWIRFVYSSSWIIVFANFVLLYLFAWYLAHFFAHSSQKNIFCRLGFSGPTFEFLPLALLFIQACSLWMVVIKINSVGRTLSVWVFILPLALYFLIRKNRSAWLALAQLIGVVALTLLMYPSLMIWSQQNYIMNNEWILCGVAAVLFMIALRRKFWVPLTWSLCLSLFFYWQSSQVDQIKAMHFEGFIKKHMMKKMDKAFYSEMTAFNKSQNAVMPTSLNSLDRTESEFIRDRINTLLTDEEKIQWIDKAIGLQEIRPLSDNRSLSLNDYFSNHHFRHGVFTRVKRFRQNHPLVDHDFSKIEKAKFQLIKNRQVFECLFSSFEYSRDYLMRNLQSFCWELFVYRTGVLSRLQTTDRQSLLDEVVETINRKLITGNVSKELIEVLNKEVYRSDAYKIDLAKGQYLDSKKFFLDQVEVTENWSHTSFESFRTSIEQLDDSQEEMVASLRYLCLKLETECIDKVTSTDRQRRGFIEILWMTAREMFTDSAHLQRLKKIVTAPDFYQKMQATN